MPHVEHRDLRRACKHCGRTGLHRRTMFCSRRCWTTYRAAHPKSRNCAICGKAFIVTKRWGNRTCGRTCGGVLRRKRHTARCQACQKELIFPLSAVARKFCSWKCYRTTTRAVSVLLKCSGCGCVFQRARSQAQRRDNKPGKLDFCSVECMARRRGPKHPSWRGHRRHFRGTDWREQAEKARNRDLHTCQVCGKTESKDELLSVDHVVPFRMWPENALVNLLSVCRAPCHASKTMQAEPRLLRGDKLGFLQKLRELGWPMELVTAALEEWGRVPQLPFPFLPKHRSREVRWGNAA